MAYDWREIWIIALVAICSVLTTFFVLWIVSGNLKIDRSDQEFNGVEAAVQKYHISCLGEQL